MKLPLTLGSKFQRVKSILHRDRKHAKDASKRIDDIVDVPPEVRAALFQTNIIAQPKSRLLTLPTEIRLMIYEYLFSPPYEAGCSNTLMPLRTCRQINSEAVDIALRQCVFNLHTSHPERLYRGLRNLGDLKFHLRDVHIDIPLIPGLTNPARQQSPFILMELPLKHLRIRLSVSPGMITTTTLAEAQKHFMSAFLHYTSPATRVGGPDPESPAWTPDTEAYNKTKSTTSSYHLSEQRDRCILRQQWNPTVEDLCNTLYHCNASRVEIVSNDREADIFFEAFQQYNFLTETKVGVGYLFQHPEMPKKVLVKGFGVFQCGSDHNGMLVVSQTVDGPIGQATNGQFLRVYTEALELWSSPVC